MVHSIGKSVDIDPVVITERARMLCPITVWHHLRYVIKGEPVHISHALPIRLLHISFVFYLRSFTRMIIKF